MNELLEYCELLLLRRASHEVPYSNNFNNYYSPSVCPSTVLFLQVQKLKQ